MISLAGCSVWFFQFLHVLFSLGGLLIFQNDLNGSIVVDHATGEVINYQDFGGGIGGLVSSFLLAVFLWLLTAFIRSRAGDKAMIAIHFITVLGLKGLIIWSIYFSGQVAHRILQEFPLPKAGFLIDALFLILAVLGFKLLTGPGGPGEG